MKHLMNTANMIVDRKYGADNRLTIECWIGGEVAYEIHGYAQTVAEDLLAADGSVTIYFE